MRDEKKMPLSFFHPSSLIPSRGGVDALNWLREQPEKLVNLSHDGDASMSTGQCPPPSTPPRYRVYLRRGPRALAVLLLVYYGLAYHAVPSFWRYHHRKHPALTGVPKTTLTKDGHLGDPLNLALVGTRDEVVAAMLAAGWDPVDPTTWRSSLRITTSVVARRPYPTAPVSNLLLWGRCQDLAFQQALGNSAKQRHHVRFWQTEESDDNGRPLWVGAATFDRSVGLNRLNGQITHHIDANIDAERNKLLDDLKRAKQLLEHYRVDGLGPTQKGKNGGGDPNFTDGDIRVGVLVRSMDLVARNEERVQPE